MSFQTQWGFVLRKHSLYVYVYFVHGPDLIFFSISSSFSTGAVTAQESAGLKVTSNSSRYIQSQVETRYAEWVYLFISDTKFPATYTVIFANSALMYKGS